MKTIEPRPPTATEALARATWYQRAETATDVLGPIAGFYLCWIPAILAWSWHDQDPSTIRRYVAVIAVLNALATVYGIARRRGWRWIAAVWVIPGSFLYPRSRTSRRHWCLAALVILVLVGTWWWHPNGEHSGRQIPSHLLHEWPSESVP